MECPVYDIIPNAHIVAHNYDRKGCEIPVVACIDGYYINDNQWCEGLLYKYI